jgi:SNF2 family DNA or RNA helicase
MGAGNLKEHQQRVVDNESKVVYHGLGSGKTLIGLTELARAAKNGGRGIFVAPTSLVNNARKEIAKHNIDIGDGVIVSPTKLMLNPDDYKDNYDVMVIDEAHAMRNPGKKTSVLKSIRNDSARIIPMTASAMYNDVSDIAPLVNLVAGDKLLPETRGEFYGRYVKTVDDPFTLGNIIGKARGVHYDIARKGELRKVLNSFVDRHDTDKGPEFPTTTEETIAVPMSEHQQKVYDYAMSAIPSDIRAKVNSGVALDAKQVAKLQVFMTGPRMAALSSAYIDKSRDDSAKIDAAVGRVVARSEEPNFKALVYSNFIEGGLEPYARRLEENGLGDKYQIFKGGLSSKKRDEIISSYNNGDKPILLVSSAGSEGLDLKGTRVTQVLEPHFNEEKIKQVIGRSARYMSHTHLPEDQRNVHVEKYISVTRPTMWSASKPTVDGTISASAGIKNDLINKVKALIRNQ